MNPDHRVEADSTKVTNMDHRDKASTETEAQVQTETESTNITKTSDPGNNTGAKVTTQVTDIEGTTEAGVADRNDGQTDTIGATAEVDPTKIATTTKTEREAPAMAETIKGTEHVSTNQTTKTNNKTKTNIKTGTKIQQLIEQLAHTHCHQ